MIDVRHGRPHHFADVLLTNAIIATTELGFKTPIAYIQSRGWVISKNGGSGRYHLEYRKLEEVLAQTSYKSSSGGTQLCTNQKLVFWPYSLYQTIIPSTVEIPNSSWNTNLHYHADQSDWHGRFKKDSRRAGINKAQQTRAS